VKFVNYQLSKFTIGKYLHL